MPKDFGNTQDLVNIEDIREDAVLLKDGGLRQILMMGGINFALKSEEEQSVITHAYQNFLNSLDFPIQILIHSRKVNIDKYLERFASRAANESSPLVQNQIAEYKEFVRGFVEKNAVMEKTFLVIVPFQPIKAPTTETAASLLPFLSKKKKGVIEKEKATEKAEESFRADIAQLKQRTTQVLEGLLAVGLEAAVLNTEQLIQLFYNFYNPETIEKKQVELPTS